jgi:hypothetical protein
MKHLKKMIAAMLAIALGLSWSPAEKFNSATPSGNTPSSNTRRVCQARMR